jgi:hypothetical protein
MRAADAGTQGGRQEGAEGARRLKCQTATIGAIPATLLAAYPHLSILATM